MIFSTDIAKINENLNVKLLITIFISIESVELWNKQIELMK